MNKPTLKDRIDEIAECSDVTMVIAVGGIVVDETTLTCNSASSFNGRLDCKIPLSAFTDAIVRSIARKQIFEECRVDGVVDQGQYIKRTVEWERSVQKSLKLILEGHPSHKHTEHSVQKSIPNDPLDGGRN